VFPEGSSPESSQNPESPQNPEDQEDPDSWRAVTKKCDDAKLVCLDYTGFMIMIEFFKSPCYM
jgi:hypothetical protein